MKPGIYSHKKPRHLAVAAAIVLVLLLVAPVTPAPASTFTWDGEASDGGQWNTGLNWVGDAAPNSANVDALVFGTTGAGTVTNNIGLFDVNPSIEFQHNYTVTGNEIELDGGDSMTLTESGSDITVVMNGAVRLGNSSVVLLTVPDGSELIFNGIVKAAGGITTIVGGGTVRLTNADNEQNQAWNVRVGRLEFQSVGVFGAGSKLLLELGVWNAAVSPEVVFVGAGNASVGLPIDYDGGNNNDELWILNNSSGNGDLALTGALTFSDKEVAQTIVSAFGGTSAGTTTVSGNIINHSNPAGGAPGATTAVKLDSSGILKLTGDNTYSGATTISAGTLLVNGTHTGGADYTVASGAKLGGTGTITLAASQVVTIQGGGTISPGTSAGVLTVSDLTLDATSAYDYEPGDRIDVDNALTLNDWTLNIFQGGKGLGVDPGQSIVLFTYGAGSTIEMPALTNFFGFSGGDPAFTLEDTGSSFVLNGLYVIPEPALLLLLTCGGAVLAWSRRRPAGPLK